MPTTTETKKADVSNRIVLETIQHVRTILREAEVGPTRNDLMTELRSAHHELATLRGISVEIKASEVVGRLESAALKSEASAERIAVVAERLLDLKLTKRRVRKYLPIRWGGRMMSLPLWSRTEYVLSAA